ncbi:hypothetical protein [Acinetobacter larvae]|uniref:Uncharacterized protein n=1 Tax=Acinetobacter larvae TaxID=1789224 RepID=A0A1B2LZV4_9GAMM|nr:hypothetical protein [Acinetobacter larvae]AOA58313.1 hypothetical protein BFG52_08035 [Acinetobacter larvae]
MNLLRNPWSIRFVVENFGFVLRYDNPVHGYEAEYAKIDELSVLPKILDEFSVSEDDYKKWLKIIFYFIVVDNNHGSNSTFLDKLLKTF